MMQGRYYSKLGLYYFNTFLDSKCLKPKFFANPYGQSMPEVHTTCEVGRDSWSNKVSRTIVVFAKAKWDEYKAAGYGDLYGMSLLHCYDPDKFPTSLPSWANNWKSSNSLPIKEYQDGLVTWLWDNDKIYSYFDLVAVPAEIGDPNGAGEELPAQEGGWEIVIPETKIRIRRL